MLNGKTTTKTFPNLKIWLKKNKSTIVFSHYGCPNLNHMGKCFVNGFLLLLFIGNKPNQTPFFVLFPLCVAFPSGFRRSWSRGLAIMLKYERSGGVSTDFLNSRGLTTLLPLLFCKMGIIPLLFTRLLLENLFLAARCPATTGILKAYIICIFPYKCVLCRV